jgi:F0F1-type ATP synthase membrane subunit b/b'
VGEAQTKARTEADAAKAVIAEEKTKAMAQLRAEVAQFSREAAQRILEEPVDEAIVKRVVA